ncbi:uncharacterized protein LOC133779060 [Humulus lupulus]|uniref:uncharacterized protein LOC133779060 n=1 Tax=Humulus lupulus TaxID=3486 RepID=UPI002B401BF7|nr:uncharacterized protein LOC133779060 [Humulus lupulus]
MEECLGMDIGPSRYEEWSSWMVGKPKGLKQKVAAAALAAAVYMVWWNRNKSTEDAFQQLKQIMCSAPILALPNFEKDFVIECDASGSGVGVVLLQKGIPIAYISKALALKNLGLSTYEKEMMAALTPPQKNGLLNWHVTTTKSSTVAAKKMWQQMLFEDCMRRIMIAISFPIADWLVVLQDEWNKDEKTRKLIQEIAQDPNSHSKDVAQIFLDNVYKLHGIPQTIVSGRDHIVTREFWEHLFSLQGTRLLMSTSYHPQFYGQIEIVNKCLDKYLRCMTSDKPREWSKWLPLAGWWYNTSFHCSSKMMPLEVVYGRKPPTYTPYIPGETLVVAVDQAL